MIEILIRIHLLGLLLLQIKSKLYTKRRPLLHRKHIPRPLEIPTFNGVRQ